MVEFWPFLAWSCSLKYNTSDQNGTSSTFSLCIWVLYKICWNLVTASFWVKNASELLEKCLSCTSAVRKKKSCNTTRLIKALSFSTSQAYCMLNKGVSHAHPIGKMLWDCLRNTVAKEDVFTWDYLKLTEWHWDPNFSLSCHPVIIQGTSVSWCW